MTIQSFSGICKDGVRDTLLSTCVSIPLGALGGYLYARSAHLPTGQIAKAFIIWNVASTAIATFGVSLLEKTVNYKSPYPFIFSMLTLSIPQAVMPFVCMKKGYGLGQVKSMLKWQYLTFIVALVFVKMSHTFDELKFLLKGVNAKYNFQFAHQDYSKALAEAQAALAEEPKIAQAAQAEAQAVQAKVQAEMQDILVDSQVAIAETLAAQVKIQAAQNALAKAQADQDDQASQKAQEELKAAQKEEGKAQLKAQIAQSKSLAGQCRIQAAQHTAQTKILAAEGKTKIAQSKALKYQAKEQTALLDASQAQQGYLKAVIKNKFKTAQPAQVNNQAG